MQKIINQTDTNLLPHGGTVHYYGKIMSAIRANAVLSGLMENIEWKNDEAVIFGKRIITKRKVAWYGDQEYEYEYSKMVKRALPWTHLLLELKDLAENTCGEEFNSCLLNLYHDGNEGMAWHSDDEKDLKENGAIGSLSFGAERRFLFKARKNGEIVPVILEHGSMLVMKDATQTNWLHRLPQTKLIKTPRVNLTFRTIDQ